MILLRQLLVIFFAVLTSAAVCRAATIIVDTPDDVLDNSNGDCSLREAITAANSESTVDNCVAGSGADVIEFAQDVRGTISLMTELPVINSGLIADLSIVGPGRDVLTISGEDQWRVLHVAGGAVVISGVTIANGHLVTGGGAGVYIPGNGAVVNLTDCRVANNHTMDSSGNGGGVFILDASLYIENCMIENNSANEGGGISVSGTSSELSAHVSVTDSIVRGNSAAAGGGVEARGASSVTIIRAEISDNHAGVSGGGGIDNRGTMLIKDSRIENNHSDFWPAAIKTGVADVTIENCLIRDNYSPFGAVVRAEGAVTFSNTTISENYATDIVAQGGGLHVGGEVVLINSTISGNTGRGIGVSAGTPSPPPSITIRSSTIVNNGAAGIQAFNNVSLVNSIVANNVGPDCDIYESSWLTDLGSNIDSDNSCWLTLAEDQPGIDPQLWPLQDNGGYSAGVADNQVIIPTHALHSSSPAIDNGDDANCPPSDQLATSRPLDGDGDGSATCDIGAYEYIAAQTIIVADSIDPPTDHQMQFMDIPVDAIDSQIITLINVGSLDLQVMNIELSGIDASDFVLDSMVGENPCNGVSIVISPGASCTVGVDFSPTTLGAKTASLVIHSDDPDTGELTIALAANAVRQNQASPGSGGGGGGGGSAMISLLALVSIFLKGVWCKRLKAK
jgi:CSLREA domain-containing protein